ncbi:MAG: hypothetical protein K7J15_02135 [Candidatus Regiella insecticola]|nr:hypothetical protein [Candidatus Regiella insecticola]
MWEDIISFKNNNNNNNNNTNNNNNNNKLLKERMRKQDFSTFSFVITIFSLT